MTFTEYIEQHWLPNRIIELNTIAGTSRTGSRAKRVGHTPLDAFWDRYRIVAAPKPRTTSESDEPRVAAPTAHELRRTSEVGASGVVRGKPPRACEPVRQKS